MFGAGNFSLSFSSGSGWVILGVLILLAFSVFYYRYTIPPLSNKFKYTLILLRFIGVALIFILLFAPELSYVKTVKVKPVNIVFIDNSNSMVRADSVKRRKEIIKLIKDFHESGKFSSKFFLFDKSLRALNPLTPDSLTFKGRATNYELLFNKIKDVEESASNVVIISDGNPTEGIVPNNFSENISVPVYTVGVGESALPPNVEIGRVITNRTLYKGEKSSVEIAVLSSGIQSGVSSASLYLNGRLADRKKIILNSAGIVKTRLSFTPKKIGINRLTVVVRKLKTEKNIADNRKLIYVNVLKKKKKIFLATSSPSSDFEFIKRALISDSNFVVRDFVEYSKEEQISYGTFKREMDSSEVLFLHNFPTAETSPKLWGIVFSAIKNGKPFYLQITAQTDLKKLDAINEELPFRFKSYSKSYLNVQPAPSGNSTLLKELSGTAFEEFWEKLPPAEYVKTNLFISPAAGILLYIKKGNEKLNFPMMISSGSPVKSLVLFADGIWKWKLKVDLNGSMFFNSFFVNSAKWLCNNKNKDRVKVYLSRSAYKKNEKVYVTAEVFDKLYNHAENAAVTGLISDGKQKFNVVFQKEKAGLYAAEFSGLSAGKYTVSVKAKIGEDVVSGKGKFTVEKFDAEKIDIPMNKNYLSRISQETGGKFIPLANGVKLADLLNRKSKIIRLKKKGRISLFPSEYLLIFIIFIFSAEWFLRKRKSLI